MKDKTMTFSLEISKESDIKRVLKLVQEALDQKGYNAINQIVGYILSEDPTYITTYNGARSLMRRVDRDELMQFVLKSYLDKI
ncbi:MAG: IreB family regulatory phosphoprotein [Clostridia bacterium]|nr:IreB family regulatory phosphoprotein [Clostridia bacterium]